MTTKHGKDIFTKNTKQGRQLEKGGKEKRKEKLNQAKKGGDKAKQGIHYRAAWRPKKHKHA